MNAAIVLISLAYIGQRFTSSPSEPDGFFRLGAKEIPFKKRGTPHALDEITKQPLFPDPQVPVAVAVEFLARNDGQDWELVNAEDQEAIDAEIARQKAEAEAKNPKPAAPATGN